MGGRLVQVFSRQLYTTGVQSTGIVMLVAAVPARPASALSPSP